MNTKRIGNVSEAKVLAKFVELGWQVLVPWGDTECYDLVINRGNEFESVQVKTGRLSKDQACIMFNAKSTVVTAGKVTSVTTYRDTVDLFAVYFRECDEVYVLPTRDCSITTPYLRLVPTKSKQIKNVRFAKDYLI